MASKTGIDHFTKAQFEQALPKDKNTGQKLWKHAGLIDGEHVYLMPVTMKDSKNNVNIEIRSSIDQTGRSADTGDDSIRAYLTYFDGKEWQFLGSNAQRWVTRLPGWEKRLTDMLRVLYGWRLTAGDCPTCGKPKHIFKVKKDGPNKGRIFTKCDEHNGWVWLTEPKEQGK